MFHCRDEVIPGDSTTIADYILWFLNQRPKARALYRKFYNIPDSEPEIDSCLTLHPHIAKRFGKNDLNSSSKRAALCCWRPPHLISF